MIIIHEGVPGAGKSYDSVRKILGALKKGRKVYTNIDGMNQDSCLEYISSYVDMPRDELTEQLLFIDKGIIMNFWEHCEAGSLICIDEAQLYFNSRDFSKSSNREFADWASTHRHHGFDLILITQRAERIDTAVRSLAEFKYRYRKLSFLGPVKGFLIYTYIGDDPKHMNYAKRSYDKKIFPAYNSYVGDASEKDFHKKPNVFKHPVFFAIPLCFAAMLYFGFHGNLFSSNPLDITGGKNKKDSVQQTAKTASPQAKKREFDPPALAAAVEAPVLPSYELFPVSGYIEKGDSIMVMVDGAIIRKYDNFDKVNLVVAISNDDIPPALVLKKSKPYSEENGLYYADYEMEEQP